MADNVVTTVTDGPSIVEDSLMARHPYYEEFLAPWTLYRDVCFIQWGNEIKERYLVKGRVETPGDFKSRVEMSEFVSESTIAIKRIVSSLYKDMPAREGLSAPLTKFTNSCDRRGSRMDVFMQKVAAQACAYGCAHVLVDKRSDTESSLRTDSDLPFLTMYSPLDVWDWESDPDGNLIWVRLFELSFRQDSPRAPRKAYGIFREFGRNQFQVWEADWDMNTMEIAEGTRARIVSAGDHNLGRVPLASFYPLDFLKPMIGRSYIAQAAYEDIRAFRMESDSTWDMFNHAHPYLAIWSADALTERAIGASTFLHMKPEIKDQVGREDARYISPGNVVFDALFSAIDRSRRNVHRQVGIDPLGIMQGGGDSASGVSRAWSFSTSEGRLLAFIADNMEDGERQIYDLASRYIAKQPFSGNIRYPDSFDLVSAMDLIKEYKELIPHINSETFSSRMLRRIANHMVGDVGQDVFNKIYREIDAFVKEMVKNKTELARAATIGLQEANSSSNDSRDSKVGGPGSTAKPAERGIRGNRREDGETAKAVPEGSKKPT